MAIRYYHEFTSQLGRQWVINIHDTSFASTASTFEAADNGFVLQYGDGASKIIDPVLGSRCEVVVQIAQTDTSLQTLISDIVAAQEGRFFIEIQEDTGGGYELYWAGRVLTDLISEPDTWPSEVTLTATDGLASLKDVRFDDDGTLYTGQVRFNDLLGLLINKAGVQVPLYGSGGSDYSLRTVVNWVHNDMGSPVTGTDPLARTRINHRTWWDEVNTDETFYAAKPSYDVLKNICQGWFGRVFQSAGRYYFMQVTQHGQNPSAWRDYSLNTDGSIFNVTSGTENREVTIDQSQVARLYLGQERYFPALKEVSSVYEHKGSNNILPNQVDFDYSTAINFPPAGQEIANPNNVPTSLKFKGIFQTRLTNNIEYNTSVVSDLTGTPAIQCTLKARVSVTNGTDTYYLWQNTAGVNQWNTQSTSRIDVPLNVASVQSSADGDSAEAVTEYEFETPPLPSSFSNVSGTFTIFGITPNILYNIGASLYTATEIGGVNWNTDYVGTADNVVIQYRLFDGQLIVQTDQDLPKEEKTFSVTNTAADDVQPDLETDNILFGQDVGGLPPGVLEVNDGSSWSINTDEWAYNAAGGTSAFNQLLVQEIMDLQSVPTLVREWQVRGVFDFYNTLVLDSVEYAPISATLTAWNDTWSGTYFEVNRDSSLVSDDDPIALPTARVIGGTSSAVNQLGRTVYNSLGGINRIAIMNDTINEGDTVTSIPVQALGEGYWKAGDTLTLFNPNSGESQRFTVSSDTTTGDTSIIVNSATASFDFYPNSPIYVSVLDSISGISTGVGTLQTVTDRGATTTNEIDIPSVQFDTTQTLTPTSGQLGWNADDETLDLGLNGGSVVHKLGETLFFNVKAAEAISKGDVLYASGAVGNSGKIEASKYTANNTIDENRVLGVAAEDISIGDFGFVYFLGSLRGITTDGSDVGETWVDGTILYASPSTAGALTSTQPVAPNQDIPIAFVTSAKATNGSLYIRATQLGYHLGEIHDVYAPSPSDGEVLTWNNANQRWESGVAGAEELNDLNDVTISSVADGEILQYDSATGDFLNTDEIFFDVDHDDAVIAPRHLFGLEDVGSGTTNAVKMTPEQLYDKGTVTELPEGEWRILGTGTLGLNTYQSNFIKHGKHVTWNAVLSVTSVTAFGSGAVLMYDISQSDINNNLSRFRLAESAGGLTPIGYCEVVGSTGGIDDGIWFAWNSAFLNPGAGLGGSGINFYRFAGNGYLEADNFNTSTRIYIWINYAAFFNEFTDDIVPEFTVSNTNPTTATTVELRNASLGNPNTFTGAWTITGGAYTLQNGTTLNDEDIDVTFDDSATSYTIRFYPSRSDKGTLFQATKGIVTQ